MDINSVLNNPNNMYHGHGTGTENPEVINSIMKNGLRCSHGSLYFTSVVLGLGKQIGEEAQNMMRKWPHKDSKIIIVVSLPINFTILESFENGLGDKKDAAFYYIPNEKQREEYGLTKSPYVMPEFVAGYYNAEEDKFIENPRYYEKLPIDEQKELFDRVKRQYFNYIEAGYGVEEYKDIIEEINFPPFPLSDEEVAKFRVDFDKYLLLSQIEEEILNKDVKMPTGEVVKFEEYLRNYALNIIPMREFIVLSNGNNLPIMHFIYENVLYECQEKYNGDLTRYLAEHVNMEETMKNEGFHKKEDQLYI